jgi:Tfp pilus assembly protein PilO
MASVGQPPLYDLNVDTGFWVRRALIAVIVVVLFLVIAWAFYWIQRRRTLHV